ncbi:MAG: DUF4157 domain-containing protein, partial [Myxococcota bacterium]
MSQSLKRRRGSPAGTPSKQTPSSNSTETSGGSTENRNDLVCDQSTEEETPVLGALESAFGADLSDVEIKTDDQALGDLGAEAATEGKQIVVPSTLNLDAPSKDDLDTLGHETAHVLGSTSGAKDVDEEGEGSEKAAEAAGAQFAAWASGGMEGQAPSLQGATGGTGKTQRKAAGQGGLTGSPMLSKG